MLITDLGGASRASSKAVGKMQNCRMWNVEGKMQNGNCGKVQ